MAYSNIAKKTQGKDFNFSRLVCFLCRQEEELIKDRWVTWLPFFKGRKRHRGRADRWMLSKKASEKINRQIGVDGRTS